MTVFLNAFRRAEMKFDNVEQLKAQREADLAAGRDYV